MRVSSAPRRGGEASPAVWSRETHRSLRSHRLHVRRESKSVPNPARPRSVSGRLAMRTASQWRLAGVAGSETIATCAPSAAAPGLSGTPPSPDFSRDATATSEAAQSAHFYSSTMRGHRLRCANGILNRLLCLATPLVRKPGWPDVEGIHAENDRPDSPAEEGHRRSISNWDSSASWPEAGLLPHACSHTVPYRECTRRRSPPVQRQSSSTG